MAAATKVSLLEAGERTTWTKDGREMNLSNPDGNPSDAQLAVLNKRGVLAIVKPGQIQTITKGQASAALDVTTNGNGASA
jgi:hypothetical protein